LKAQQPVIFNAALYGCIMFKFLFEHFHNLAELWWVDAVSIFPLLFQKIIQPQLGGGPNVVCRLFRIFFAVYFNFPKIVSADNVLKQMRHFRKRAPLAVFRQVVLELPGTRLFTM